MLLFLKHTLEYLVLFYSCEVGHNTVQRHGRTMRMQEETSNCEHETHQSLINSELMTVMDCRNCRETGETNCPEVIICSLSQGQCEQFR